MKKTINTAETKIVVVFFLVFSAISMVHWFDGLEVKTIDWRFRTRPAEETENRIVLVNITDDCLEQMGKWPWSRRLHARALDFLASAGARLVAFDLLFNEPSREDAAGDDELAKASRAFGKTVLPMFFNQINSFDSETSEMKIETELLKPFFPLGSTAKDLGLINLDYQGLNPDGIVRRIFLTSEVSGETLPFFPLAVARSALDEAKADLENLEMINGKRIPFSLLPEIVREKGDWSVVWRKTFFINYLGMMTSGAFKNVYYSDLINGTLDPGLFRDKIVLIGPSAAGLGDIKLTPYGEMPGVLIHANIVQNLLTGNFLSPVSDLFRLLVLALLSSLTLVFLTQFGSWTGLILTLCLLGLYDYVAFWSFDQKRLILDLVVPNLMGASQFLSGRFYQMFDRLKWAYQSLQDRAVELEKVNTALDSRVQELLLLNEAGSHFPSILDFDLLSQEVLGRFKKLSEADDAILYMYDPENDVFQFAAASGFPGQEGELLLNDPEVIRATRLLVETLKPVLDPTGGCFTSYLPLMIGVRLWGGIFLRERVPETLTTGSRGGGEPKKNRKLGEQFWMTLAGLATTALENAKLYHLATVDGLTRLFVRRFFQLQIDKELKRAKRYRHTVALIMTDVDHFKKFNDTYGHQQGDLVLREVATIVKASLRDVDIPARYGGEEFALVLPETTLDGARIVAERIRQNVERALIPRQDGQPGELKVTISLGVSSFPDNEIGTSDDFIKLADEALYLAKKNGRNRVGVALKKPEETT